jgi:hypothetical protein
MEINPANKTFCANCGALLENNSPDLSSVNTGGDNTTANRNIPLMPENKKKTRKTTRKGATGSFLWVLVGIIICLVAAIIIVYFQKY